MGSQVKLYFNTIVDDNDYSITVVFRNTGKEVTFDKVDVVKLCLVHNYVLVKTAYARKRGLV